MRYAFHIYGEDRVGPVMKIDVPLLLIIVLLVISLSAYLVGWIVYPFGIMVLGLMLLYRISSLFSK